MRNSHVAPLYSGHVQRERFRECIENSQAIIFNATEGEAATKARIGHSLNLVGESLELLQSDRLIETMQKPVAEA